MSLYGKGERPFFREGEVPPMLDIPPADEIIDPRLRMVSGDSLFELGDTGEETPQQTPDAPQDAA
jgi:hypothetical protein